jgi:hypothetical protein
MTPKDLQALSRNEALFLIAHELLHRMFTIGFDNSDECQFLNRIVHMIKDMSPPEGDKQ